MAISVGPMEAPWGATFRPVGAMLTPWGAILIPCMHRDTASAVVFDPVLEPSMLLRCACCVPSVWL